MSQVLNKYLPLNFSTFHLKEESFHQGPLRDRRKSHKSLLYERKNMASVHLFTEQTDIFTTGWRPWCPLWADARRRVRKREDPPMARTQGTSAGRGEAEAGGRNRVPVLPEGRLGGHATGGMEPRVHAGPGGAREILVWAQNILGLITVSLGCSGERSVLLCPCCCPQLQRGGVRGGHSSLERTAGSNLWDRAVRTFSNFS